MWFILVPTICLLVEDFKGLIKTWNEDPFSLNIKNENGLRQDQKHRLKLVWLIDGLGGTSPLIRDKVHGPILPPILPIMVLRLFPQRREISLFSSNP